ncbi:LCP family protein [Streptomyces tsukubensis]|uniref:LytR family transcriptional regulator n=2 Tax=Streptomyces tsukubensis TaxID=83656 RepID=A0A1V4A2K8_9ACTN|nr:LytR family transcriptional regulator [Streptomyces tsukubensis]
MPKPPRSPAPPPGEGPRPRSGKRRPGPGRRDGRRVAPRWVTRTALGLSMAVLAAAGIGHAVYSELGSGIARIDPFKDMKNRPEAGDGMNVLLVGTDGRDKITPEEKEEYRLGGAPCHCTDTIMIVHISADRSRAGVVSLPRDSYAEMPPHTDQNSGDKHQAHPAKINAAYAEGGPQLTVRTVEHMTKVKIDHYLEVDFTSFMRTVDVLGGVDVCTTKPLADSYTGLDLPAGTHRLNGGQALQYVRSRHVDGAADLGRMQRQQRFLAALIARTTSSGVLLNPVKFRDVAGALFGSVRADKGFGTGEMLNLAKAMHGFRPSSSEFTSVPVGDVSYPVKGIGATVKWDTVKSRQLFDALREDRPLTAHHAKPRTKKVAVAPDQIRVQVETGTGKAGLGERVDAELRATGFDTTGSPGGTEAAPEKRTTVLYDPDWDRSAKSLAAAFPGSELREEPGLGPTLRVVVGTDFKQVTKVRAEEPEASAGGKYGAVTGDEVTCR